MKFSKKLVMTKISEDLSITIIDWKTRININKFFVDMGFYEDWKTKNPITDPVAIVTSIIINSDKKYQ